MKRSYMRSTPIRRLSPLRAVPHPAPTSILRNSEPISQRSCPATRGKPAFSGKTPPDIHHNPSNHPNTTATTCFLATKCIIAFYVKLAKSDGLREDRGQRVIRRDNAGFRLATPTPAGWPGVASRSASDPRPGRKMRRSGDSANGPFRPDKKALCASGKSRSISIRSARVDRSGPTGHSPEPVECWSLPHRLTILREARARERF